MGVIIPTILHLNLTVSQGHRGLHWLQHVLRTRVIAATEPEDVALKQKLIKPESVLTPTLQPQHQCGQW